MAGRVFNTFYLIFLIGRRIVIATTGIINGTSLINSMSDVPTFDIPMKETTIS